MAKVVFTTRVEPEYDDLPEVWYHFPSRYLPTVAKTVDDWIVYYEPRRTNGRQAYFATAKIISIGPDINRENHFYAFVSDYLEFDQPVPFKQGDFYYESKLQREDGKTNKGAFGRAVRSIPEEEYERILEAGFHDLIPGHQGFDQVEEPALTERPLIQRVITRPFRDAAFSKQVKNAYDNTCAITGLKLINGGGRSEVQAAHIKPVASQGPDSVRNGIALSGTIHWMFDRGLISIDDDYSILIAENRTPDFAKKLINPNRHLRLPSDSIMAPHRQFLSFHRENIFKG